jgi:hypothetical protein
MTNATSRGVREAYWSNRRSLSGHVVRRRVMNQRRLCRMLGVAAVYLAAALPASALTLRRPQDSVNVGGACVDKYEASMWQVPASNAALIRKVQLGRATLADLTNGATQVSPVPTCSPALPARFDATGNWTSPLFAVSGYLNGRV